MRNHAKSRETVFYFLPARHDCLGLFRDGFFHGSAEWDVWLGAESVHGRCFLFVGSTQATPSGIRIKIVVFLGNLVVGGMRMLEQGELLRLRLFFGRGDFRANLRLHQEIPDIQPFYLAVW
jgi:hypothetical protein